MTNQGYTRMKNIPSCSQHGTLTAGCTACEDEAQNKGSLLQDQEHQVRDLAAKLARHNMGLPGETLMGIRLEALVAMLPERDRFEYEAMVYDTAITMMTDALTEANKPKLHVPTHAAGPNNVKNLFKG